MPEYTQELQTFSFDERTVKIWVPVLDEFLHNIPAPRNKEQSAFFPFWAKLWPSAIAMCRFITANPSLIAHKKVLELAAGLGLPGILAAQIALEVTISDYVPDAVAIQQSSVALNELTNITCRQLDWYALPPDLTIDILLLSDINYDPSAFEVLYEVLTGLLNKDTTILLTTPQRLMAKPFIERLLPYCVQQDELEIDLRGERAFISVLVLRRK